MTTYLSTFVAGLGKPVRQALQERLPGVKVELELDGVIAYDASHGAAAIRDLTFFNNSFIVLKRFDGLGPSRDKEVLNDMLAATLRDSDIPARLPRGSRGTFRIVTAWSNVLTSVDQSLLERLERKIAAPGRLKVHRGRPDHELWLSYRNEGYGFFMLRLTSHTAYERVLEKGELRPELAYILCWLSEPREGELVLDPFCGSGAIPLMRATQFPRSLVLTSDLDEKLVSKLKEKVKRSGLRQRIVIRQGDARHLARYENGSIHKIVTDPPWGMFQELETEPEVFYLDVLSELGRILAPGGIMVLLMARTELISLLLGALPGQLELVESYSVLVSGKKASIYKLRKPDGKDGAPDHREQPGFEIA